MIEPDLCLIMTRATAREARKAEVRLAFRTSSQSEVGMRKISPSRVMPALLTSTSTPPASATMASTAFVISSSFVTSAPRQ